MGLIILKKHNKILERRMLDISAEISSKSNRTISATIVDIDEINKEKNSPFIKSIKDNMELIYGKNPF